MTLFGIQVERSEWRFVWWWGAAMAFVSLLPHIIAYITTPVGSTYALTAHPVYQDVNTYFTWIRQAAEGHLFFEFQYSFEAQARTLFHPVFLLMGLLVRIGFPMTVVWLGVQVMSVGGLILSLFLFMARFFQSVFQRRYALMLVTVAGGFGFLGYLMGKWPEVMQMPTDASIPEATIGGVILWPFIFCIALSLMLLSILSVLRYLDTNATKYLLIGGGLGFMMNLVHPYDAVILLVVVTLYLVILRGLRAVVPLITFSAVMLLPTLYHVLLLLVDDVSRGHSRYLQLSPSPIAYLLGFGMLLPLALAAIVVSAGKRDWRSRRHLWFLVIWLATLPLLLYIPLSFQRRLIEGAIIPIVILAVYMLREMSYWIRSHMTERIPVRTVAICVLLLFSGNFVGLIAEQIGPVVEGGFPKYLTTEERKMFDWLASNATADDIILASPSISNFIPRFTGAHVYFGHDAQSINGPSKLRVVEDFYLRTSPGEYEAFLHDRSIDFVVYGPHERAMGVLRIDEQHTMTQVAQFGDTMVLKVN